MRQLRATRPLFFDAAHLAAGAVFEADDHRARRLVELGHAAYVAQTAAADAPAIEAADDPGQSRARKATVGPK